MVSFCCKPQLQLSKLDRQTQDVESGRSSVYADMTDHENLNNYLENPYLYVYIYIYIYVCAYDSFAGKEHVPPHPDIK